MTKARFIFAAVVAAFARPDFRDVPAVTHERAHEDDGLVSPASASRIAAAFSRFQRALFGGSG